MRERSQETACGRCGAYAGTHQPGRPNNFCECSCHETEACPRPGADVVTTLETLAGGKHLDDRSALT
jgi:hypothetical protein